MSFSAPRRSTARGEGGSSLSFSSDGGGLGLGQFKYYDSAKVRRRIVTEAKRKARGVRFPVYKELDDVFGGGLPYGVTLFYGITGSGKSKMCKFIANQVADAGGKVIYVASEAIEDVPIHENIVGLDYCSYLPKWEKAVHEVLGFANEIAPALLVIDSGTTLFSSTAKAVEEADIRSGVMEIEKAVEYKLPVIITSQVRGSGNYLSFAGGQGVGHACAMLVKFDRIEVEAPWHERMFDKKIGAIAYTMTIVKDRFGLADTSQKFVPVYYRRGLNLVPLEEVSRDDEEHSR